MRGLRIALATAFLTFVGGALWMRPSPAEQTVRVLLNSDWLVREGDQDVSQVLTFVTKSSKFENKWQVNLPPKKDLLNVYLIHRPNSSAMDIERVRQLEGNAGYIGRPNIIVIDVGFVSSFADQYKLYRYVEHMADAQNQRRIIRRNLLTWIIGHELGHILHGHSPSHFETNRFVGDSRVDSLSQKREIEADTQLASILAGTPTERIEVEKTLLDLINFEITTRIGIVPQGMMILYDYKDQRVVKYREMGSHPEFIVRATRLLEITSKAPGSEALNYEVRKFSELLRPAESSNSILGN